MKIQMDFHLFLLHKNINVLVLSVQETSFQKSSNKPVIIVADEVSGFEINQNSVGD